MSKEKAKFYPVAINPNGIGDRFDEAEAEEDGDQQAALLSMAEDLHIEGLLLNTIRKLLETNPDAVVVSFGDGIAIEGLAPDVLKQVVADGMLVECEESDEPESQPGDEDKPKDDDDDLLN